MRVRQRITRNSRKETLIFLFLFTVLCGFSADCFAEIDLGCEGAFLSKRTLGDWGIGEAEVLHWLSRTDSAPVLRAAAILEASLREPPKEALEIITLLTYARLGDDASEGSVVRHFRRWAGVEDMEVILGVGLDEIGPYLTNLYLAGRFAKGQDARIWLRKLLSSPVAMMLVARAMALANPPDRRRLQPSESNASNDQLAADRILMQRGLGSGDLILFDFARSTPAMAWAFSRVMFDTLFSTSPDNGWMQLNRLGFIEWVAKKMRGVDAGPPNNSGWEQHYAQVLKLAKTPIKRWPKSPFFRIRDYTMGDGVLIEYTKLIARMVDSDGSDQFIPVMLREGPRQGVFLTTDAVRLTRLHLALAGCVLPTVSETRSTIRRVMAEAIASLKTLVPVGIDAELAAPVAPDSEPFVLPEPSGESKLESKDDTTDAPSDEQYWDRYLLINYLAERLSLQELAPETEYRFHFTVPHHKFVGEQRAMFSKRALKEFTSYRAVGVDTMAWLRALSAGIAPKDGAKGIKPFIDESSDDLPFEVKLMTSAYRLLGHRRNGVWYVEHMEMTH